MANKKNLSPAAYLWYEDDMIQDTAGQKARIKTLLGEGTLPDAIMESLDAEQAHVEPMGGRLALHITATTSMHCKMVAFSVIFGPESQPVLGCVHVDVRYDHVYIFSTRAHSEAGQETKGMKPRRFTYSPTFAARIARLCYLLAKKVPAAESLVISSIELEEKTREVEEGKTAAEAIAEMAKTATPNDTMEQILKAEANPKLKKLFDETEAENLKALADGRARDTKNVEVEEPVPSLVSPPPHSARPRGRGRRPAHNGSSSSSSSASTEKDDKKKKGPAASRVRVKNDAPSPTVSSRTSDRSRSPRSPRSSSASDRDSTAHSEASTRPRDSDAATFPAAPADGSLNQSTTGLTSTALSIEDLQNRQHLPRSHSHWSILSTSTACTIHSTMEDEEMEHQLMRTPDGHLDGSDHDDDGVPPSEREFERLHSARTEASLVNVRSAFHLHDRHLSPIASSNVGHQHGRGALFANSDQMEIDEDESASLVSRRDSLSSVSSVSSGSDAFFHLDSALADSLNVAARRRALVGPPAREDDEEAWMDYVTMPTFDYVDSSATSDSARSPMASPMASPMSARSRARSSYSSTPRGSPVSTTAPAVAVASAPATASPAVPPVQGDYIVCWKKSDQNKENKGGSRPLSQLSLKQARWVARELPLLQIPAAYTKEQAREALKELLDNDAASREKVVKK